MTPNDLKIKRWMLNNIRRAAPSIGKIVGKTKAVFQPSRLGFFLSNGVSMCRVDCLTAKPHPHWRPRRLWGDDRFSPRDSDEAIQILRKPS
jgi:hypothetical protein